MTAEIIAITGDKYRINIPKTDISTRVFEYDSCSNAVRETIFQILVNFV